MLDCGGPDFEDEDEVFDAIGGVLQGVSADFKNEEDIRDICLQMFNTLKLYVLMLTAYFVKSLIIFFTAGV